MNVATVPLGELCEILSGFAWSASKFNQDKRGLPIIRIQNVDAVLDNDFVYWDEPYDERFVIRGGDLLLTLSGSFRVEMWTGPDALLNQRIIRLTPSRKLDKGWLLHVIRPRLSQIERLGKHALVNNVSLTDIRNLSIPLPSLAEQRRIAKVLDQAEALSAKRRAALGQLDTFTQSIFLDLFGDPATNPKSWPIQQLQEVVKEGTIVTYGIVQAGEEFPGGVPYIRTGDIVEGEIVTSGLRHTDPAIASKFSRSRVEAGDIVMSIRATVGTTALVPPELDGANLTQGTGKISPGKSTERLYLLNYLRTSGTQHWISLQIKGATFREITLTRLRELPVAIPPISLQREFGRRAMAVKNLKASYRASLAEMDALFASIQHRAFRGEL